MTTAEIRCRISELREQRAELDREIIRLQTLLDAAKEVRLVVIGGAT